MAAYENVNNDHTAVGILDRSAKPPPPKPAYTGKPKSRIADLLQPSEPPPATPPEVDDHDVVYNAAKLKPQPATRGKAATALFAFEWLAFAAITTLLISSLTVKTLKGTEIWSLDLWRQNDVV